MADRVGQQLGNYRLTQLLGQGGFAEVYLGEHVYLKNHAALKVLHTQLSEKDAASFVLEAQTLARLSHPHIVRVLDFAVQDGTPFLVMEYAPQGTLRNRHAKGTRLPVETVVHYVQQVAAALQYAHDQRLVHRDVKPENLLLNERSNVLLSDFGLGMFAQHTLSQSIQEMVGTASYMAPEQIRGKPRPASDQYSLGIVVYEWLTGDRPFGGSPMEIATQHLFAPPPSLCERIPTISPVIEKVVLRTLAKESKQRFASVQDFATALQHAVKGSPSPPSTPLPTSAPSAEPINPFLTVPDAVVSEHPSSEAGKVPVPALSTADSGSQETIQHSEQAKQVWQEPTPSTSLIGRTSERERITAAWQSASAGRPQLLVLSGEAGIGKTRLAEALLTDVGRQGIATAIAHCYAVEGELAYTPVVTWLRSEALRPALAALDAVWLTEVARLLPELLLERPGLPPPSPLREDWQRQRLFEALARALQSSHGPLLLLLDDLQWCDRETLAWLHYLLRFDPHARLLIVGTLRIEELSTNRPLESLLVSLRRDRQVSEIALGPLDAAETAALASYVTGRSLSPALAANLYQETEGNPLFVVETMRMGVGEHAGSQQPTGVSTPAPPALPSTMQAVIAARLEQLSPPARELVNVAAVIGRAFTFEVLKQVSGLDEDALVGRLDELWQRRIIREQGNSYDFSHDKLREGAYAGLSRTRRRLLHRHVAEALEAVYADDADALNRVSGHIAVHYEHAGVVERAITYYRRAAEVARRLCANAEAIRCYQRVLMLLNAPSSRQSQQEQWREVTTQVDESLGDVFALTGQLDEARAAYQEALAQVPMHDYIRQAHLHRKRAQTWKTQRRFDEGLQAYSTAEATLEGEAAERTQEWWQEWIEIQHERIEIHYLQAQLHELTELIEQTRPVVERYGAPVQRADFFLSLARMSIRRDRFVVSEEVVEYARSLLAAHLELEDETGIAWARFILGYVYLWHGDLDMAEEQIQAAQVMGEQTGDVKLQSRCLTYLTVLSRKRGQVEEARRFGSQALAIAIEMQLPDYIAMAKANLAWIAWREGDLSGAQANALAALELWRPLQVVNAFHWMALWPLIGVELTQDRLPEAIDHARQLLDPQQQPLPDALNALVEAAIRSWDAGQLEAALTHLRQGAVLARDMGYL